MACDLAFWLKTLSESSEVIELDLKLGKSPDGNFWHKYPKVIWDNGEQIKTGLSNFEKNKKIFVLVLLILFLGSMVM